MKMPGDESTKLRREISNRRTARSRLSGELRARCERYASRRAAAGATQKEIASELGVSTMSVQRWLRDRPRTATAMVPVRIVAPTSVAPTFVPDVGMRVAVTTPNGFRVDGLNIDALCMLIARFG